MAKKFKDFVVRDKPVKRGIHKKSQNKNEKKDKKVSKQDIKGKVDNA